jgi:predicted TPR repeat methyltransferase
MENEPTDDGGWLLRGSGDVDDVQQYYDGWAAGYDADLAAWSYQAPDVAGRLLLQYADAPQRVLDAGCGTGLVGSALRRAGYDRVLDGVDVSAASLRLAERRGVYDSVGPADLQTALSFDDDQFDGLVCVGVMTYVPDVHRCWLEFARVVRPGGVVVVTQREDLWDERDCQAVVDRLVALGTWTVIEVTEARPYLPGNDDYAERIGVHYVVARVGGATLTPV